MRILHPSIAALNDYVDGELSAIRHSRVVGHLKSCSQCRDKVQEIKELSNLAAAIPQRTPPAGVFDRVLTRRAAGERVILTTDGPPRQPHSQALRFRRAILAAAAVVLLLVGLPIAGSIGELGAERAWGELTFSTTRPTRGSEISVEFRDASIFAGVPRLVLRARYRTPRDGSYNGGMKHHVVAELSLVGDNLYSGRVTLPDSVVFAVFSVETPDGRIVDSNRRRLRELIIHDENGNPLSDALIQRSNDMMGRNWELAFESAKELERLYPNDPEGLNLVSFFEPLVIGEQVWIDSVLPSVRERYDRLNQLLDASEDISGDQIANMMWLARRVEDSVSQQRWKSALVTGFPDHTQTLQQHIIYELLIPHGQDTVRVTSELDSIWIAVEGAEVKDGPGYGYLMDRGLQYAIGSGDIDGANSWADRYLEVYPNSGAYVAGLLVKSPALRQKAIQLLEEELDRLRAYPPENRPLTRTVEEHRRQQEIPIQRVLAALGKALLADNQTSQAAAVLEEAGQTGWDTGVFRQIAEALVSLDETEAALTNLARVAADPNTSDIFSDSVANQLGTAFDSVVWQREVLFARNTMRERTLRDAKSRRLPDRIRLVTADGSTTSFSDIVGEQIGFVVFWDRYCGFAIQALPGIQQIAQTLEERGVEIVIVAEQPPSEELDAFMQKKEFERRLYHDTRREASRAFNNWGSPTYFITDGSGRVRFEYTSLESAVRQVDALIAETESAIPIN